MWLIFKGDVTFADITQGTVFNLYGELVEQQAGGGGKFAVFRLKDGTYTKKVFRKFNLESLTQDVLSPDAPVEFCNVGSACVDVLVPCPSQDTLGIQVGTAVCLYYVRCLEVPRVPQGSSPMFHELFVDPDKGRVIVLPLDHPRDGNSITEQENKEKNIE